MASLVRPGAQCLRSTTTIFHATLLNTARSSFHSLSRPSSQIRRIPFPQQQPSITSSAFPRILAPTSTQLQFQPRRHASSAPATSTTTSAPEDVLTWDRFFALRRRRRYLNLASSLVTAAGAVMVFGPMLAAQDIDGWAAQVSGLDPIIVLGACGIAVAAGGWLCGPTFGNSVFKIWAGRKGWNGVIAEKEKSFFARIRRYRADPSSSSPQNPIPDYYGEKIASVKDYRRWLKDQRAFNLKKNKNML